MGNPLFKLLVFLVLTAPLSCFGQFSISGRVLSQVDSKPVANANVFINNATISTSSDVSGLFDLRNIKAGKYDVVISYVGFETVGLSITVTNSNVNLHDIVLVPKIADLAEVTIKAKRRHKTNYFDSYYPIFKKEFLGTSTVAADCKILDPEKLNLNFNNETNILTASSADFLNIENRDLGYEIKYQLMNFSVNLTTNEISYAGPVLFTEMKGTAEQEKKWKENRQNAYEGSTMNFLRSVSSDRLEENNFRVYRLARYANPNRPADSLIKIKIREAKISGQIDQLNYWKKMLKEPKILDKLFPYTLNRRDLILGSGESGLSVLGCDSDRLVVDYEKDKHFIEISALQDLNNLGYIVNKPDNKNLTMIESVGPFFFFDEDGVLTDPKSIKLSGIWAKKRVGDLLPANYVPPGSVATAPDSVMKVIDKKMDEFSATHVTEKVHLHLDRSWYSRGDTLWFKGYVVAGADHRLSELSAVLHAELINDKDSVVRRLTLQLNNGTCNGDFELPPTYSSGVYRLRAYTNWMLNDSANFYDQKIVIGGLPQAPLSGTSVENVPVAQPGQKKMDVVDLQFFPEGGDLIAGLRSKVAFKAIGANGLSVNVSGKITDEEGNELAVFKSGHLGMGEFPLTPLAGKRYTATGITSSGTNFKVELPTTKADGCVLTVNYTSDSIYVKVAANDRFYKSYQNALFYIVAQSGGKTYYSASRILSDQVFSIQVEKKRFPSGISQFTLFSSKGEPLSERILYVENNDQLKLNIGALKATYSTREEMKLNIEADDKENNAAEGLFSVSVTDETKAPVDEKGESNILTDLLLTSELKGYVEDPGYYFRRESDQTRKDLDMLMLTQGYRKFNWKKIFAGNQPSIVYQPQTSTTLSGTVTGLGGKPLANRRMRLTSIKDHFVADTVSDVNGNFTFDGLYLSDTTKVIVSAVKIKGDNNIDIHIKAQVYPSVNIGPSFSGYADTGMSKTVREAMLNAYVDGQRNNPNIHVLKEVKIKANRKNPVFQAKYSNNMSYSSNLNGPGNANQVLLGDKLMGCITLSQCLQGKLPGVAFNREGLPIRERTINAHLSRSLSPPLMAVFIDGIQHNPADINTVNVQDIYSIEVLISISYLTIYGSNAPNGALIITLKNGGSEYKDVADPVKGIVTYKIDGFYKAREFYSPKYDPSIPVSTIDNRKTIYWKPNISTDKDGKASIEYFNAGDKGIYRVVIEGIDAAGNLGRQVFRYTVE